MGGTASGSAGHANEKLAQNLLQESRGLERMDQGDFKELVTSVTEGTVRYLAASAKSAVAAGAGNMAATTGAADARQIAALIDHTLLKPEATREDVRKLCQEAVRFGFASVCVNPCNVPLASKLVRRTNVKVCTVIGFPLGATLAKVKIQEAKEAIKLGAQEVDMVINIGALKSGDDKAVESDIRGVVQAAHRGGAICKVILETCLLSREEKVRAARACKRAGADFVKTSTGFSTGGATAEDVALLRSVVGPKMGVKASGGIRSLGDLRKMVTAGATRIGASAGVKIMEEAAGTRVPSVLPSGPHATQAY
jgi:deoxyribose-phosphate aldolase